MNKSLKRKRKQNEHIKQANEKALEEQRVSEEN